MDFVIFVKSCARDRRFHSTIRETWGAWTEQVDIRFVLGGNIPDPRCDELVLPARDGYDFLWEKTREANLWALKNGYKRAMHACTDTYVVVPRLLQLCNACAAPYIGGPTSEGHLSGGAGYVLDETAMWRLSEQEWYAGWEDKVVCELLAARAIAPVPLDCFRGKEPEPWDITTVSVHLGTSTGSLVPEMIRACDRRFVEAFGDAC